jgi:hypothetical protein
MLRIVTLCVAFVGLTACSRVNVEVIDAVRVEGYPERAALNDDEVAWRAPTTEFVRIDFKMDPELSRIPWSDDMQLRYDLHACDAPDMYTHTGDVFIDPARADVYQAYVPAHFSNLHFWVTGGGLGQLGRGWPDEVQNERLCFRVYGGINYGWRVSSDAVPVQGLVQQFMVDTDRAGE